VYSKYINLGNNSVLWTVPLGRRT